MRRRSPVLLMIFGLIGCSEPRTIQPDSDAGIPPGPSPVCDRYLECVAEAQPDLLEDALSEFGPVGSCWSTAQSDEACINGCRDNLERLAEFHYQKPSCSPHGRIALLDGNYALRVREVFEGNDCPTSVVGAEANYTVSRIGEDPDEDPKVRICSSLIKCYTISTTGNKLTGTGVGAGCEASYQGVIVSETRIVWRLDETCEGSCRTHAELVGDRLQF